MPKLVWGGEGVGGREAFRSLFDGLTTSKGDRDRMVQSFASLKRNYLRRLATMVLLSLLFVASLVLSGCDPGTTITVENRTSVPIDSNRNSAPLDYSGPVELPPIINPNVLQPGQEMEFTTLIHPDKEYGSREKYIYYAVNLSGKVVYQRTFTWDELNSQGWRVVIEPGVGIDQIRYMSVVNKTDLTLTIYWDGRRGARISPLATRRVALVFVGEPSSFVFEARKAERDVRSETEVVFAVELTEGQLERQDWTIVVKTSGSSG